MRDTVSQIPSMISLRKKKLPLKLPATAPSHTGRRGGVDVFRLFGGEERERNAEACLPCYAIASPSAIDYQLHTNITQRALSSYMTKMTARFRTPFYLRRAKKEKDQPS